MIPHPDKAHRGGEDAFFAHASGLCVADGVGGYAQSGVDPAIFTRCVVEESLRFLNANTHASALATLNAGVKAVEKKQVDGGCPVTMATLIGTDRASILNLGDCGILVLRDGQVVFRTVEQQHYFNCPFQLPSDPPSKGTRSEVAIEADDVFVCASDGVFDNLRDDEITRIVQAAVGKPLRDRSSSPPPEKQQWLCKEAAEAVARRAAAVGADKKAASPFAAKANAMGLAFQGGKLDDVTVVVAAVRRADEAMERLTQAACPALFDLKMITKI
jgi:serine/threonine protein phosphatase PrpC